MGKSAKPPPAPDYTALAEKTAATQNPNQVTPFGTLTRKQLPDGTWEQTTTLDPADQARLDAQRGNAMSATTLQGGLLGQAANSMAQPFESKVTDPGFGGVDALKQQYLDYVRPEMDAQQSRYASMLRQRGIPMNSAAWSNATRSLMDSDARRMWEATDKATSAYNDIFQRGLAYDENARVNRNLPLVEALRAGGLTSPVGLPTMPSPGAGTDYLGAADKQYQAAVAEANAKNASRSGMISGLMGLGGSILGGPIGGMIGNSIGGMMGGGGAVPSMSWYGGSSGNPYAFTGAKLPNFY